MAFTVPEFIGQNTPQRSAAIHTYRDLTEVKLWYDVTVHACQQLIYFLAREHAKDDNIYVVPISAQEPLSPLKIDDLFRTVATNQTKPHQNNRVILALVDTDTTVVYYNLYTGIQPPTEEPLSRKHR